MKQEKQGPMEGLFLLVDRRTEKGLIRWIDELNRRKIPALVMADGHTINNRPDLMEEVVKREFDIGGLYNEGAFWPDTHDDMIAWLPSWISIEKAYLKTPYEVQKTIMEHINDKLEPIIGKTMPVFSGKYFSYDENTQKIADELGISYILARGTEKERAVFYKPEEFGSTIISVSNVPSKELGTGSLCDESLKTRNETSDSFRNLLNGLDVDKVIVVAQTHLSGLDDEWWQVYEDFFDSDRVSWKGLSEFVVNPVVLPNQEIPVNKEANYMAIHLQKAKLKGEMV